jgi:hypothetical protein
MRERNAFRKGSVHHGNFAEADSWSIFLAARNILGPDLIIICQISSLSFNLLVSKRFPHHDSVCFLSPPLKKMVHVQPVTALWILRHCILRLTLRADSLTGQLDTRTTSSGQKTHLGVQTPDQYYKVVRKVGTTVTKKKNFCSHPPNNARWSS